MAENTTAATEAALNSENDAPAGLTLSNRQSTTTSKQAKTAAASTPVFRPSLTVICI